MSHILSKSILTTCQICNANISSIKFDDGKSHYLKEKFVSHMLVAHSMTPEEYLEGVLHIEVPFCKCGCGKKVGLSKRGSDWRFCEVICGHTNIDSLAWKSGMQRLSKARKGIGNPRFCKKPWNYKKTRDNNKILAGMGDKGRGRVTSAVIRKKQSVAAKKRKIHGHTGKKHSPETIAFLRQNTLKMIEKGAFSHTKTKPHVAFSVLLEEMDICYLEEKRVGAFSFDFYLPDYEVFVEIDGDYFHAHPDKYPNGPETKTQKRNCYRDRKKNEMCVANGLKLLRFWECQVLYNKPYVIDIMHKELKWVPKESYLQNQ